MVDLKNVELFKHLKNSFIISQSDITKIFSNTILFLVFPKLLKLEVYAHYEIILNLSYIAYIISDFGTLKWTHINSAKYSNNIGDSDNRFFFNIITHSSPFIFLGSLFFIFLLIISEIVLSKFLLIGCIFWVICYTLFNILKSYNLGLKQFKLYSKIQYIESFLIFILLIPIFLNPNSIELLVFFNILYNIIIFTITMKLSNMKFLLIIPIFNKGLNFKFNANYYRSLFQFFLINFSNILMTSFPIIWVDFYYSSEITAYTALAIRVYQLISIPLSPIGQVLTTHFASSNRDKWYLLLKNNIYLTILPLFVGFSTSLIVIIIFDDLIIFIYGINFVYSYYILRWLIISLLLKSITTFVVPFMLSIDDHNFISICSTLSTILMLLMYIFVDYSDLSFNITAPIIFSHIFFTLMLIFRIITKPKL